MSRGCDEWDDHSQEQSQTAVPGSEEDGAQHVLRGQLRDGNLLQGQASLQVQVEREGESM